MTTLTKNSKIVRDKILVVKREMNDKAWNKSLPTPLLPNEKVIVCDDQTGAGDGYVRVKHGKTNPKVVSCFSIRHFLTVHGKEVKCS